MERHQWQQFNTDHLLILAEYHHPPSSVLTLKSVIILGLSSKVHGSKEHEKEKETQSFYA